VALSGTADHHFPVAARVTTHRFKLTDISAKEYPTILVNQLEQV
jgi:hypothetical protein